MTVEELKSAVSQVKWWHRMDLGNGIVTPGRCPTSLEECQRRGIPEDLRGRTVLDIGAWDGYYSFEAERRGADRVLATDSFCWGENPWTKGGFGTKAGFDLARRALNSKVEDLKIDVLDLSPDKVGVFNMVFFFGVLYHMRHPLLALERVFSCTERGGQLILETHVDLVEIPRPALAYYPDKELNNDETNWCGPNPAAVEAMLKTVGFKTVKMVYLQDAPWDGRLTRRFLTWNRRVARALTGRPPREQSVNEIRERRATFHAWR
jgi:tRNA (mo5U34)-methyltransferase